MNITHYPSATRGEKAYEWIACICCLGMIAGLFFSRAILSLSMFIMLLNALQPARVRDNWQIWKQNRFALFAALFFGTYLVSGLWSGDKDFWWAATLNKLPFLVLPFAFTSAPLHKEYYRRVVITGIVLMQLGVVTYSLACLALNPDYYLSGYSFSNPLPTTKYNDHIRFSLSLVLSLLMCFFLLFEKQERPLPRWLRYLLSGCCLLFIGYLHILAAKTGLVCLYFLLAAYIIVKLYKRHKLLTFTFIALLALVPVVSYFTVNTFQTKVKYVLYEIEKSKREQRYDYTLSDAGRMITYDIGAKALAAHPLAGTGAGDLMHVMREGYAAYYPEVSADQQYGPINQFMYTALSVGIPLSLILCAMVFAPLFVAVPGRLYLIITTLLLWIAIMVEAMLEVQFGVFTYLFFVLFWLSALANKPIQPKNSRL
ncbi:O-antigen ligase family protein [Taibaiella chishuiensis]|uniref:O-antigen ligase-like membrane protein n=1 Tax=Taibaiella chishuiensis TaxID=1434707 RepID=A0A2P8D9T8_9BACT|nr:O-antigen ligase family protein [Taibaiella chishuiensis]PSK93990.1 O-antigen ligase-like membrane protein [Taibaiella chishuiensis]